MNVLTISGNLGSDCKKNNVGGSAVANFSVPMKSGFGDKETTTWVDCALWGRQAESKLTDYLTKGQGVVVSGELGTRTHENKTYLTLRVNSITLMGNKAAQGAPANSSQPAQPHKEEFSEDVPF